MQEFLLGISATSFKSSTEVDFWELWENWIGEQNGKKKKENKKEQNALSEVEKEPTKDPSCAPLILIQGK